MKHEKIITPFFLLLLMGLLSCNNDSAKSVDQGLMSGMLYTCPMPEDSVFSHEPGRCPKCGMDLVLKDTSAEVNANIDAVLRPSNEFVLSSVPVTTLQRGRESIEVEAVGEIGYDTRTIGSVSANISGRIEKLYVRFRYQPVLKGQKLFEIYSPELVTAQQNLLFLLKDDPDNERLIQAANDKLLLLGMSPKQLRQVIQTGKALLTVTVFSPYSGHVHESMQSGSMDAGQKEMQRPSGLTEELSLKEGMYVQKGQSVLTIFDPGRAWALLNIFGDNASLVQKGNSVRIVPEAAPDQDFRAAIDFIEPLFRPESKTPTARVYFNNRSLKLPIGSQVRATIFGNSKEANWLPGEAVLSLGINHIVFKKEENGFVAVKVNTGLVLKKKVQILDGLSAVDSVASNAQYLMDSESFIKIKP